MIPIIPSTRKPEIFVETVPRTIRNWQPSDAMTAALVCRLNGWPLWTPIAAERVMEFRQRVLVSAASRGQAGAANQVPSMPRTLDRSEQHAVLRLELLMTAAEIPSRSLVPRILSDDFWAGPDWDLMQRGVIPHHGLFFPSARVAIGRTLAYAARKVGTDVPIFAEAYRAWALNPLHVVVINAGTISAAEAWHDRLTRIYWQGNPAPPALAGKVGLIPPHVEALRTALSELETTAEGVLESVFAAPAILAAVCEESTAPCLGLIADSDPTEPAASPAASTPAPEQSALPVLVPPGPGGPTRDAGRGTGANGDEED